METSIPSCVSQPGMAISKVRGVVQIAGPGVYFAGSRNQASPNQSEADKNPIVGVSQSLKPLRQTTQTMTALAKTAAPKSHLKNEIQRPGTPLVLLGTARGSQAVFDQSQCQSMLDHMADPSRSGMVQDDGPHFDTFR